MASGKNDPERIDGIKIRMLCQAGIRKRHENSDSTFTQVHEAMPTKPLNVLFLCTGNSARSIIAEAILNKIGKGRFSAFSAGSHPRGEVHPLAVNLLSKLDFDVSKIRSKSWDEFAQPAVPEFDFVFTVCDDATKEECPNWLGQPMKAHWGIPDPIAVEGNEAEKAIAFADTYRMLNNRISVFASLPFATLKGLSLQAKLNAIGKDQG